MVRSAPLLVAFLLSGASGLAYEVVWARWLSVLVGGTAHGSQAVLATFFLGLMAGAFLLGRRAARSPDGARFYVRLELGIAAAGALSALVLGAAGGLVAGLGDGSDGPRTAALALAVTLVACLPATLLMGATFAAVARALQASAAGAHNEALLGRAYAANTVGAVLGSVGAAFVALPALGVRGTLAAAIAGNVAAALLARAAHLPAPPPAEEHRAPPLPGALAAALALSGFAAISLQIVALRVLAVTLQDTIYTFAIAIAAYIGGASLTAAVLGRRARPTPWAPAVTLAAAALLSALWLPTLRLGAPIVRALGDPGAGFFHAVSVEAIVALLLAAPAAIPTTWVFLALAAQPAAGSAAAGAGRATAWNGLGCAVAPVVSALVLLPASGTVGLAATAIGALAVAAALLLPGAGRRSLLAAAGLVAGALALVAAVRGGLHEWTVTPGWRLVWKKEGASATVSVEESPTGQRRLRTNNNFTEGGDVGAISQLRQGMIPTLFVPDARSVLVLGVGSGITLAGAVAGLPQARFDAVELLPEIRRAVDWFSVGNGGIADRPNVSLHVADARAFAAHQARRGARYDLVVGELFHASQAGTGALYSREHFAAVRALLAPGGVFCQWLPLHEAPPHEVRTVVRTFFRVFPHGAVVFGSWTLRTPILGLVGAEAPVSFDWDEVTRRLAAPPERAARAALSEVAELPQTAAAFIAPAEAIRRWAGDGPENTDDRPELELGAPRRKAPDIAPANVFALMEVWQPPDGLVTYGDPARREHVVTLQRALLAYFRGMQAIARGDDDAAEAELRRAHEDGAELRFVGPALRDVERRRAREGR